MIYLDTSAAFKLMRPEVHSAALADHLRGRDDLVSSTLLAVELRRGALRSAPRTLPRVDLLLARVDMIAIDAVVVESAGRLPDPLLRTLDAIHVATALLLGSDVEALITYDERMLAAAEAHGLPAVAPA